MSHNTTRENDAALLTGLPLWEQGKSSFEIAKAMGTNKINAMALIRNTIKRDCAADPEAVAYWGLAKAKRGRK